MLRRTLLAGLSSSVATASCGRTLHRGTSAAPSAGGEKVGSGDTPGAAADGANPLEQHGTPGGTLVSRGPVSDVFALGAPPWRTFDPFLFCVHHKDAYGKGNEALGPAASLEGRQLGSDFAGRDGWNMYHGETVPGFPRHPHRGFETVTVARRGFIDHSDSMGATARYGQGDVQWMTAGGGVVHAEMFPLVSADADNPVELFQIWLNLPKADKFVEPHFAMFWAHTIPRHAVVDSRGKKVELVQVAGHFGGARAPNPPPHSWASRAEADLAIWTLELEPGATFELPATGPSTERTVYFFAGKDARFGGERVAVGHGLRLTAGASLLVENGTEPSELLLLQARPIGEPVVQRGPFVMNTPDEIVRAYRDYRATEFGGWPWKRNDPVHTRTAGRFAIHADGREEKPS